MFDFKDRNLTVIKRVDDKCCRTGSVAFGVESKDLQLVRRAGVQVGYRVLEDRIAYFDGLDGFGLLLRKIVVQLIVRFEIDNMIAAYDAVLFVSFRWLPFDVERRARYLRDSYVLRYARNLNIYFFK